MVSANLISGDEAVTLASDGGGERGDGCGYISILWSFRIFRLILSRIKIDLEKKYDRNIFLAFDVG